MVIILFGLIFVAVGIVHSINQIILRKTCTTETRGTVVQVIDKYEEKSKTDIDGNMTHKTEISHTPVFSYYANGEEITKKSKVSGYTSFKEGDSITVFYNSNNVDKFYVKEDNSAKFAGVFFIIAGLVFTGAGLMVLLK